MRVVLDSNVLFSALISPYSPPHRIFQAWQDGRFELITCHRACHALRVVQTFLFFMTQLNPAIQERFQHCLTPVNWKKVYGAGRAGRVSGISH